MPGRPSSNSNLYREIVAIVKATGSHKMRFLTPEERMRFHWNFARVARENGLKAFWRGLWLTVYERKSKGMP